MGLKEQRESLGRHIILAADNGLIEHSLLSQQEKTGYDVIFVNTGFEVMSFLSAYSSEVSLFLCAEQLPDMSCIELINRIKQSVHSLGNILTILFSRRVNGELVNQALSAGCTQILSVPIKLEEFQSIIMRILQQSDCMHNFRGMIKDSFYRNERRTRLFAAVLSEAVEFRKWQGDDLYPFNSGSCIKVLLKRLRSKTNQYNPIDDARIEHIAISSMMQNIGYVMIPQEILSEPGELTDEEYEIIKKHPENGAKILEEAKGSLNDSMLDTAIEIARYHHERWDGTGYPRGLKGDEIPISAQVSGIANVYATLVENRPYRSAYSHDDAIRMIISGECGAFSPVLMECLKEGSEEIRKLPPVREYERALRESADRNFPDNPNDTAIDDIDVHRVDMTEKKQNFYASLSHDCIFEYQDQRKCLNFSSHTMNKFGLPAIITDIREHKKLNSIISIEMMKAILTDVRALEQESDRLRKDLVLKINGRNEWNRIIAGPIYSEDASHTFIGIAGVIINVDNEHMHISQLEQEAAFDPLTKLRNRRNAEMIIRHQLEVSSESEFCFCILDFDNFKSINDNMGHTAGDIYLMEVGMLLKHYVRRNDIVGRLGGDEFVWFFSYEKNPDEIIHRVFGKMNGSVVIDDGPLLSISLGAVTTKQVGRDIDRMYEAADYAMYEAKRTGKGIYQFYHPEILPFEKPKQ